MVIPAKSSNWYDKFGSSAIDSRDEIVLMNVNEKNNGSFGSFESNPGFVYNSDQVKQWIFVSDDVGKNIKIDFTKIEIEESDCKFLDPDRHPRRGEIFWFSVFEGWDDCCLNDFLLVVVDGEFKGRYCGNVGNKNWDPSFVDRSGKPVKMDLSDSFDDSGEFLYGSFFMESRKELKFPCKEPEDVSITEKLPVFEGKEIRLILMTDGEDNFDGFSFEWSVVKSFDNYGNKLK